MRPEDTAMLEALVTVAWADGYFVAQEHEFIDSALESFGATEEESWALRNYAATPHSLDEVDLSGLAAEDATRLIDLAVVLSHIDGEQVERERERIDELIAALPLEAADAAAVVAGARARAEKLLTLL